MDHGRILQIKTEHLLQTVWRDVPNATQAQIAKNVMPINISMAWYVQVSITIRISVKAVVRLILSYQIADNLCNKVFQKQSFVLVISQLKILF